MGTNPELAILQTLANVAPFLAKERQLFAEANNQLLRMLTPEEFADHIRSLKDKRRIEGTTGEDGPKWGVTDEGFVRFNQLRRMP